ncbi:DUF2809 domain-containing protein [Flavobacteriaceae bacterium LYZ1037]|nr:DUF2809 domain-containing protein [Flavobacteriaceae bacterium LYZ1037]
MKLQFNKTYFILFVLLFITEALIAIYLKTGFIRHTFGDFLIVLLMYCFIKSFLSIKPLIAAISVLIISFSIEFLQMGNLLYHLNLQNNTIAKLVLGSTFQTSDLVAYTLGIITVLIIEKIGNKN